MARSFPAAIFLILFILSPKALLAVAGHQQTDPLDIRIDSAQALLNRRSYEAAGKLIDSLLSFSGSPGMDFYRELRVRNLYGRLLLQTRRNDAWPELYDWCLRSETLARTDRELDILVRMFNNAGIAFKRLEQYSESEEAYLKSCEQLRKMTSPDLFLYGSVTANAGNALRLKQEYERAIEYLEQSIGYFNQSLEKGDQAERIARPKSDALNSLGLVYQALYEHEKAIPFFEECLKIKRMYFTEEVRDILVNLSISLIEADTADRLAQARQALESILSLYPAGTERDRTWAVAAINLADVSFRIRRDTAVYVKDLRSLRNTILEEVPDGNDEAILARQLLANLYQSTGRYQESLAYWSEACALLDPGTGAISMSEIPYHIRTLNFNKLIELMNLNARIYYDWGNDRKDVGILLEAEKRYAWCLRLVDSLRNSLELQSSKIQLSRMMRSNYDQMIELQYSIFELTRDSSLISRLFTSMEQSKSSGLWSSLRTTEFMAGSIPEEELQEERKIRDRITNIQGRIMELTASAAPDQNELRNLKQDLLFFNQQTDSLKNLFRDKYPEYYKAKFDQSTLTLEQVRQKLSGRQMLVEYALAYDNLYRICITPSRILAERCPYTPGADSAVNFILDYIKGRFESFSSSSRKLFCRTARDLYRLLIPDEGQLSGTGDLLIIPDQKLSYIPFEALLNPSVSGFPEDYRKLPYLVRNYAISYGLTATIMFHESGKRSVPSKRVLAVAPTYRFSGNGISEFLRRSSKDLPELEGTLAESQAIRTLAGGGLLKGRRATEQRFRIAGPDYAILHLAMHSLTNRENALNSCLVFTPGADRKEDGILYGHEIYNLSLKARLAVLSACETGSGQMATGEGVLSFGRAFIMAGCPNLIMTLWRVDDRSSQKIMVGFYENLLNDNSIADALRLSKLQFLDQVDQVHAHPYYWAGFIELGRNEEISLKGKPWPGWIALPSAVLLAFVLIMVFKKKNPRGSGDIMERRFRKL